MITTLRCFVFLELSRGLAAVSPNCPKLFLCCHTYSNSTGILTCFPFPAAQLGCRLGMTNPSLNYIEKEPLPFRPRWISHRYFPTTTRILITTRSTNSSKLASILALHQSTLQRSVSLNHSIGNLFRPVYLRGKYSRRVSCYALFKGLLLLSKPPLCLRILTPFTLYHLISI